MYVFAAIFENLLETRTELCIEAGKQGLITWLLKRIKLKAPFDTNKLYASEILSIMLQNTQENRLLLGDLDGIDVLLQQLAVIFSICICFSSCNLSMCNKYLKKHFSLLVLQKA